MSEATYNPKLAEQAQEELCEEKGYPYFAPRDGRCWRCRRNIYLPRERTLTTLVGEEIVMVGISVEEAGADLITGCPHCNYSFCD